MSTTINNHQQASLTTPINGTSPIDATQVTGNDNAIATTYNAHDADPGIHIQSSVLASRPAAGSTGRIWFTSDTLQFSYDNGSSWLTADVGIPLILGTDPGGPATYMRAGDAGTLPSGLNGGTGLTMLTTQSGVIGAPTGMFFQTQTAASAGSVQGVEGYVTASHTTGTVALMIGAIGNCEISGSGGTVTAARGVQGGGIVKTGATVTTFSSVIAAAPTNTGTITTLVGLDVSAMTAGGTNYAIRTSSGLVSLAGATTLGSTLNVTGIGTFSGNISINTTTTADLNFYYGGVTGVYAVRVTNATGVMELRTNSVVGLSISNSGAGVTVPGTLAVTGNTTLTGTLQVPNANYITFGANNVIYGDGTFTILQTGATSLQIRNNGATPIATFAVSGLATTLAGQLAITGAFSGATTGAFSGTVSLTSASALDIAGAGTSGGNNSALAHGIRLGSEVAGKFITYNDTTTATEVVGTLQAWNTTYNIQAAGITFSKPAANTGAIKFYTASAGTVSTLALSIDSTQAVAISSTATRPLTITTSAGSNGLILNQTAGGVGDDAQLILQRNGTSKWQVGNNVSLGSDAFQVYDVVGTRVAFWLASSTSAATFGGNVTIPSASQINFNSSNSALHIYGGGGATHQWDFYLTGNNLRISDNTGGGTFVVDTAINVASSVTASSLTVAANGTVTAGAGGYLIVQGGTASALYLRSGNAAGNIYMQDSAGAAATVNIPGVAILGTDPGGSAFVRVGDGTAVPANISVNVNIGTTVLVGSSQSASSVIASGAVMAQSVANSGTVEGGFFAAATTHTSGTVAAMAGVVGACIVDGSGGTVTAGRGLLSTIVVATGATITTAQGVIVGNPTGAGTITTNVGVEVAAQTKGATNFAIRTSTGTVSLGDHVDLTKEIRLQNTTVAGLTAAATAGAGALAFVTDATQTAILGLGLAVAGGGANKVIVYSDGSSWLIL